MSSREFGESFARETWPLYGVGMFVVAMRLVARVRRLSFRGLQADDYLMLFAVVWYTILCVALNKVASGGGSNLMTADDIAALTPAIHAERTSGSKWVFVSEHSFVLCIWSLKYSMLILYRRITDGLSQKRLVHFLMIYVGLGFVGTELALFLICRPLSNYWAVPTPNVQCASYQYYEIVQGCFAITADVLMLFIGIPLLVSVRLPWKQKAVLLVIFGLGIFVIVAAILTKIYCLVPKLISYVYMNWYFREATVAMLVTNLPMTWSLLRDMFPIFSSWTGGSRKSRSNSGFLGKYASTKTGKATQHTTASRGDYDLQLLSRTDNKTDTTVSQTKAASVSSDDSSQRALRIRQDVTITVEREQVPSPTQHPPTPQQHWPDGWQSQQTTVPTPHSDR